MPELEIRRPKMDDIKRLNQFFSIVITDTFMKEGIGDRLDDINAEIKIKEKYIKTDFESNGDLRYFLIALDGDKIIGSIEYGPASELIRDHIDDASEEMFEVGTVFVHPDYQQNGVGNLLLHSIYLTFQENGLEEFFLDSGYRNAQKIWIKKFGQPDYLLKDYWGEGFDHMIWRIKVRDYLGEK